ERSLALSPNLASAHWASGRTLIFIGRPQEGLEAIRTSLRLDPRGSYLAHKLTHIANALYLSRAYADAAEAASAAIRAFPDFPMPYRWLAAALGQLGRSDEARTVLATVTPGALETYARNRVPWHRPEDHAHMLDGLRKAGWEG